MEKQVNTFICDLLAIATNLVHFCLRQIHSTYTPFLQRWYVNGEIECFSGSHMALAVLATLVLMAALAVTVLMLVANRKWRAVSFFAKTRQ